MCCTPPSLLTLNLQFLDELQQSTAVPPDVNIVLGQLDNLDYDVVELILDHVQVVVSKIKTYKQTTTAAFIAASALQRKIERTKYNSYERS